MLCLTRMLGFAIGSRKGSLSAMFRPTRVKITTTVVKMRTSRMRMMVVRFRGALGSSGPGFLDLRDLKPRDRQISYLQLASEFLHFSKGCQNAPATGNIAGLLHILK